MLVTDQILQQPPVEVLAKHGTSFYFASLVFTKKQRNEVAELYSFCRYVDDCADELALEDSIEQLQIIQSQLKESPPKNVESAQGSLLNRKISSLNHRGVNKNDMNELLKGAIFDVGKGKINTDSDLIQYCYRVAGVVGLMMCPLLGVRDATAQAFAIDLGIGMQLTNICRDIQEDAQNGRTYLPQKKLTQGQLNQTQFIKKITTPDALKKLVHKYLDLADLYYESGYQGLAYIPFRARLCILVAGEVYRAIGHKIRRSGFEVLRGRTYLSLHEKFFIVLKTFPKFFSKFFWIKNSMHQSHLHTYLTGLSGTKEGSNVVS